MTQDEADKIAKAIGTVDHACATCVVNLCEVLNTLDLGFAFEYGGGEVKDLPHPSMDWADEEDRFYNRLIVTAKQV